MQDQRGGIIWRTQGPGKSLTMVFLVRIMDAEEGGHRLRFQIEAFLKRVQQRGGKSVLN